MVLLKLVILTNHSLSQIHLNFSGECSVRDLMKYEIIGNNLQMVRIGLQPGEGVYAEAGSMVNMSGSVAMESQA